MSKNLEIEYKLLINEKQYNQIINDYKNFKSYTQINYYFDTFDFILQKKRYMLRVREKNGEYEFTLKKQGTSVIGIDEYNEPISLDIFKQLCNQTRIESQILDLLESEGITINQLFQQYHLETIRTDIPYLNGILSLDKNNYLNLTDYEIEYEVTDPTNAIDNFNQFLKNYNLKYIKNCFGKRHRLFNAFTQLKEKK